MEYTIDSGEEKKIIKCNVDLLEENIDAKFKEEISGLLQTEDIVFDLEEVELLDSIGIGFLIGVHNRLFKLDKKLGIRNVRNKDIRDLLKTMRLDRHFKIEW